MSEEKAMSTSNRKLIKNVRPCTFLSSSFEQSSKHRNAELPPSVAEYKSRGCRKMSKQKRNYKDSVFVDLFSEDEKAKENFYRYITLCTERNLKIQSS